MKIQLPKTYSQNDSQWRFKTLGSKGTIGDYGCLLTCVAMVCTYFGHEETPSTLNDKLKNNGGFANGNLFVWGAITNIYRDIMYQGQVQTPDALTLAQMQKIKDTLDKGYPVIMQIDTVPATTSFDEHWILAIGYDGDDFIVQDPWDGATKRITSWGVVPQKLIYAFAYYVGTPTVTIISTPQPSTPSVSGNTIPVDSATFQKLVGKATQWDTVAAALSIDNQDATGGQKAVESVQKLQFQMATASQGKEALNQMISQLQSANNMLQSQAGSLQTQYSTLQQQYGSLQSQYTTLNQQYMLLQQNSGDSSGVIALLQKQNEEAKETIKSLQEKVVKLESDPKTVSTNASTKPFWESKKVIVTGISGLMSLGLIIFQGAQITPADNWETVASKLVTAAIGALGISTVASQYVKVQGAIDAVVEGKV